MAVHSVKELLPYAVNFTAVAGLVYYIARKPLQKMAYQRHEHQKDKMDAAKEAEDIAKARFNSIEDRLKKFDENAKVYLDQARVEAEREARQIEEKGMQEAERIRQDSLRIVANEEQEAGRRLQKHVTDLAISQTETMLKENMKDEDHQNLIKEASSKLEAEC